jgi:hypothetical protein
MHVPPDFYDFEGNPISFDTWSRLFLHEDRRVAATVVDEHVNVSTVFLGLDHGFGRGAPLIYETMTFVDGEGADCWRTPDRDAALVVHDQAVAHARETAQHSKPLADPPEQ